MPNMANTREREEGEKGRERKGGREGGRGREKGREEVGREMSYTILC